MRQGAEATAAWEITRPTRRTVLPGVTMAGFRIPGDRPMLVRAIPHPAVTMAVEFGDRPLSPRGEVDGVRSASLAAGLAFRAFRMRAENVACVQLRLSPLVAHSVLGLPLADLGGTVVTLDDLWGRAAPRLRERLDQARTWPERFALVDAELRKRCGADRAVAPEVAFAWRAIVASHGQVRVGTLAAETGWSRQRLSSRFGAQLGLTPKRAAMLVRFDRAVHRLLRGHAPAQVAAEFGYVDQSHLHHEIRAFAGTTPSAVANEPWLAVDDRAWPTARGRRPDGP